MTYVVVLYVEGGSLDGELRAVGPFEERADADMECVELVEYGQADVVELSRFADALIPELRDARVEA